MTSPDPTLRPDRQPEESGELRAKLSDAPPAALCALREDLALIGARTTRRG